MTDKVSVGEYTFSVPMYTGPIVLSSRWQDEATALKEGRKYKPSEDARRKLIAKCRATDVIWEQEKAATAAEDAAYYATQRYTPVWTKAANGCYWQKLIENPGYRSAPPSPVLNAIDAISTQTPAPILPVVEALSVTTSLLPSSTRSTSIEPEIAIPPTAIAKNLPPHLRKPAPPHLQFKSAKELAVLGFISTKLYSTSADTISHNQSQAVSEMAVNAPQDCVPPSTQLTPTVVDVPISSAPAAFSYVPPHLRGKTYKPIPTIAPSQVRSALPAPAIASQPATIAITTPGYVPPHLRHPAPPSAITSQPASTTSVTKNDSTSLRLGVAPTPVPVSTSTPTHLRATSVVPADAVANQSAAPSPKVGSKTPAATNHEYTPPHLRRSSSAMVVVGQPAAVTTANGNITNMSSPTSSSTPPHLRGKVNVIASAVASKPAPVNPGEYTPPHLRHLDRQSSPQTGVTYGRTESTIRSHQTRIVPNATATSVGSVQVQQEAAVLTNSALAIASGFKTSGSHHLDHEVLSDIGVNGDKNANEDIRGIIGQDTSGELLDWVPTGVPCKFAPPPADWDDRGRFDRGFVNLFIEDWSHTLPCGPEVTVDMFTDGFVSGQPIVNKFVSLPQGEPTWETLIDREHSMDSVQQFTQTTNTLIEVYNKTVKKRVCAENLDREAAAARYLKIANAPRVPDQFSPAISMYLRPVHRKDAIAIMHIYNHYVQTSIVTEDNKPVSLDDIELLIKGAQEQGLPMIVAVKGCLPALTDAQGRLRASKVAVMPQAETIIGFAFAERFGYGLSGLSGRSRPSVGIQMYVQHQETRKGVGRNVLDRLLHCLSMSYSYHNTCPWINPKNDKIYESGGSGLHHQMMMTIPMHSRDDPTFSWLSSWLWSRFSFKETARLTSVLRNPFRDAGGHHFNDLVYLQCQAHDIDEFSGYVL